MPRRYYHTKLTNDDKKKLHAIAKRRWISWIKGMFYYAVLPIIGMFLIMIFIDGVHPRGYIADKHFYFRKSVFYVNMALHMLTMPFLIIAIASTAWFLRTIPLIYLDIVLARKRLYPFQPTPYTIHPSANYYISTGLPEMLYIPVNYEQYIFFDYSTTYCLEITPFTKIVLGMQKMHSTYISK